MSTAFCGPDRADPEAASEAVLKEFFGEDGRVQEHIETDLGDREPHGEERRRGTKLIGQLFDGALSLAITHFRKLDLAKYH